jgi:5-methyltetrahydrofolate--homocysteine methyltransferase
MNITQTIYQNVLDGDTKGVEDGVNAALHSGLAPDVILQQGLISAMDQIGKLFEEGEVFVPEMLVAARAMQAGLAILRPRLAAEGAKSSGRVAIGTVEGDLHDIGKNLVAMMLEGAGFEVKDLGINVPPTAFVQAAHDGAQVLGISALLTTTMQRMGTTIDALKAAGVRDQVKVIVGGAPLNEEFAKKIGADAYAADAASAVRVLREMMHSSALE